MMRLRAVTIRNSLCLINIRDNNFVWSSKTFNILLVCCYLAFFLISFGDWRVKTKAGAGQSSRRLTSPLFSSRAVLKREDRIRKNIFNEILTTILAILILFHALIEDHFHKLASYLNSFYIFKKSFYIGKTRKEIKTYYENR